MPETPFEKYSRAGRRGGNHNTPRQPRARSLGVEVSAILRAQRADARALVVQAHVADGKTKVEIGRLLGMPRATVYRLAKRPVNQQGD